MKAKEEYMCPHKGAKYGFKDVGWLCYKCLKKAEENHE